MKNNLRIMVLIGPSIANKNTLATLLNSPLNVVGAAISDQRTKGLNIKFLKLAIKRQGIIKTTLQVIERIAYKLLNGKRDKNALSEIFNSKEIEREILQHSKLIRYCCSYDDSDTINWIATLKPDLILIHTPYWVSKRVRDLVSGNIIGAHPGITEYYRGVHSPFWAIINNDLENVGFTIFWVDKGVDSGDIIFQGKIPFTQDDTYMTISWRGMFLIAKSMVDILQSINDPRDIPRKKNKNLVSSTIYYHPTIIDFVKYRTRTPFK
ncbi:formyltransferase family protein [Schleiferiaceae bacterium]|nr:formyltransferase family protein [Schleiferiaceae bacterium]